jgi:hypothetical protein
MSTSLRYFDTAQLAVRRAQAHGRLDRNARVYAVIAVSQGTTLSQEVSRLGPFPVDQMRNCTEKSLLQIGRAKRDRLTVGSVHQESELIAKAYWVASADRRAQLPKPLAHRLFVGANYCSAGMGAAGEFGSQVDERASAKGRTRNLFDNADEQRLD